LFAQILTISLKQKVQSCVLIVMLRCAALCLFTCTCACACVCTCALFAARHCVFHYTCACACAFSLRYTVPFIAPVPALRLGLRHPLLGDLPHMTKFGA